jgi:hypothetical protein
MNFLNSQSRAATTYQLLCLNMVLTGSRLEIIGAFAHRDGKKLLKQEWHRK